MDKVHRRMIRRAILRAAETGRAAWDGKEVWGGGGFNAIGASTVRRRKQTTGPRLRMSASALHDPSDHPSDAETGRRGDGKEVERGGGFKAIGAEHGTASEADYGTGAPGDRWARGGRKVN